MVVSSISAIVTKLLDFGIGLNTRSQVQTVGVAPHQLINPSCRGPMWISVIRPTTMMRRKLGNPRKPKRSAEAGGAGDQTPPTSSGLLGGDVVGLLGTAGVVKRTSRPLRDHLIDTI